MSETSGTSPRRSWPQRLLIASNAVALVAALVTAGVLAYSNNRLSRIERLDLSDELRADELAAGDPQNYLVVGIDDASGLDEGDSVRNRDSVAGLQTDTIMIVRVDPAETTARVLSFPRDLWVPIADTSSDQRINAALATGGPERLIRTIDEDFGIPIHHYVQVDFAGFRELVDVVGGVPVHFPRPTRARSSGLVIEESGCYTLGPVQALGFARARKDYQVQDAGGRWHTDLGGDFSRIERQQLFIRLALRQAISKGARNPNTLRRLIDLGVESVRIDDALEPQHLVDLGLRFRDFDPEDLVTHTLPVDDDVVGGAQVLRLREEEAEPVLALFRGEAATDPAQMDPAEVTVQVLNGTGEPGQGGEATEALIEAGFEAIVSDDAPETGGVTTVRHPAGMEAQARLVATYLRGPVAFEESTVSGGADIVVVTGTDWVGVTSRPRPADEVAGPSTTDGSTTSTEAGGAGSTTTDPPDHGTTVPADPADVDDVTDPDDPLFYEVRAPNPSETCPPVG